MENKTYFKNVIEEYFENVIKVDMSENYPIDMQSCSEIQCNTSN